MRRALYFQWILLATLSLFLAMGTYLLFVASQPAYASLTLTKGQTVEVSLDRLFDCSLEATLEFRSDDGRDPKELGELKCKTGHVCVDFPNPGLSVKLAYSGPAESVKLEAFPSFRKSEGKVERLLVPEIDRTIPNQILWGPYNLWGKRVPKLSSGSNNFRLEVVEVAPELSGEVVRVIFEPPVSLKNAHPSYHWLQWFYFWQVFAGILAIYMLVLLFLTFIPLLKRKRA
jgi:hypothetical protein